MRRAVDRKVWFVASVAVQAVLLFCAPSLQAQRHGGSRGNSQDSSSADKGDGQSSLSSGPQPYGGQIYCPVTGVKLGLNHPPVPVQTSIGEKKPSFFEKLVGKKGTPGLVIHACCPACAEKIRANPWLFLQETIADKSFFTFTYAMAPAQRPPRVRFDPDEKPATAETSLNPLVPAPSISVSPANAPPP